MHRDHFHLICVAIASAILAIPSIATAAVWNAPLGRIKDVAYIESHVSNVTVNGSSVVSDKIANITVPTRVGALENDSGFTTLTGVRNDATLWNDSNPALTNTIVKVTDNLVTNIAVSILEPAAKTSVEEALTEMLGADWKTKYGTGAAGIIAAILAAIAYLKKNKQDKLVGTQTTGQNIKTINGSTVLGSGDMTISASTEEAAFDPTGTDEVGNSGNTPTVSTKMITPRNAPYAVTWGMIHAANGKTAKTHSFTTLEKTAVHEWLGVNQLTFVISDGSGGTTTKTLNVVSNEV